MSRSLVKQSKLESENFNIQEIEKPDSDGEIILDIVKGVCSSAAAGVAATSGNIPAAVGGIILGAESFLGAVEKYNENIQFEEDVQLNRERESYERSHDNDSWDRDY